MKGIKHWLHVFFLVMFIFFKKMYFENDETGVSKVHGWAAKFFLLPNHGGKTFTDFYWFFLKILSADFTIQHLCKFLEKKISIKSQNFCFYLYQVFSKSLRVNRNQ